MKTTTRTAAPETGRGAAPEIFNAVLAQLVETTASDIENSEMPSELERTERRRLALLRLAAASKLPFPVFYEELDTFSGGAVEPFYAQMDTLNALYDVCCAPEPDRTKAQD